MNQEYEKMRKEFQNTGANIWDEDGKTIVEIWSTLRPGLPGKFLYGKEAIDYANRRACWDNCEFDDDGNIIG